MSFPVLEASLGLLILLAAGLFIRASLKGGKQLGALWDKREGLKRARESRDS